MTEGLITRIGKWIDHRWASKVTETQLAEAEARINANGEALAEGTRKVLKMITADLEDLKAQLKVRSDPEKQIADLTTRIEKIELGTGMYRKVDPTKAPVAKSAFQM